MANKKNTLEQRWKQDKNPVGIVKGAKKGKKVPITVVKNPMKNLGK